MGVIYKAFDKVVGREVAIKTMGDIQGRAALEMFYKEWRVLANLHHPNIVEIFDIGEFQDGGETKPYFVMPLLPGMTLDQLVRQPGQQVTVDRLVEIISQTCRGLQAIHDSGLVHRDLKPSNIFVLDFNSVKLIDFGVAHMASSGTVTGMKGTLSYMAPEQIQNQECSPQSDIYSLGVVCYEVLCGVKPFQGAGSEETFDAILHRNPPPIYEINPAISQMVSRVVHKALAKQPRHRYANAMEFGETLQRALRGEAIPALDPTRILPRIQRAGKAFEQGNYQMASDILADLESSGHVDPALTPLRHQVDQALRRKTLQDLLERARMGLAEEELALALQNVETALKLDPANEEAAKLREAIQGEIAHREIDDRLRVVTESMDLFNFTRARQVLRTVLDISPDDQRAGALLQELEAREQAFRSARQEKEDLYRIAREAWQNSEFDTAAAQLQRVIELEGSAPDSSTGDVTTNYANFLTLAQAAQAAIERLRADFRACIAEGQFDRARALCNDAIAKYPGHAVPQALSVLAEAQEKRYTLARIGEIARHVAGEPELERKLDMLRRAADHFPGEPLFEQWARPIRDQLAMANGIAAKARAYEERGRLQQALEQLRMLAAFYPEKPGLEEEIDRVAALAGREPEERAAHVSGGASTVRDATIAGSVFSQAPAPTPERLEAPAPPPPQPPPPRAPEPTPSAPRPAPPAPAPAPPIRPATPAPPPPPRAPQSGAPPGVPATPAAVRKPAAPSAISVGLAQAWSKLSKRGPVPIAAAAVGLLLLIGVAWLATAHLGRRHATNVAARPVAVVVRSAAPGAEIRVGDHSSQGGELRADLAPGSYPMVVAADGYESYQGTLEVPAEGLNQAAPDLRPLASAVHLSANLQNAKFRLDDRPETVLPEAGFTAEDLAPGDHKLYVTDGSSEAQVEFTTAFGKPPELKGSVNAKEVLAFAATGMGPALQVNGSAAMAKVSVDGQPPVEEAGGGFRFANLTRGPHGVVTGEGKDERQFGVESGSRPGIWLSLYSDRNLGALIVKAGLPQFQVFLDGSPYKRRIRDGAMPIYNLAAKNYKIRIAAEGYDSPPERDIEVKKGDLANISFTLSATPQFATLAVHGTPPRTQVVVDNAPVGSTDSSGAFTLDKVSPGEHTIELRNAPQYRSTPFKRGFAARETVAVGPAEARLERAPATVNVTSAPEGALLEWTCGSRVARGRGAAAVECAEAQLTVKASLQGYGDESRTVELTPGGAQTLKLELKRIAAAAVPQTPKKVITCGPSDLLEHGWTAQQEWSAAGNAATLPCSEVAGQYQFTVLLPKGVLAKAVQWTVSGAAAASAARKSSVGSTLDFVLEKKTFAFRGGQKVDLTKYEENGSVTFLMTVAPGWVTHQVRANGGWTLLNNLEGDFRKYRVTFSQGARIGNFTFKEQ
jgi:tetratricopeptide (TPR) repeat protein